MGGSYPASFLEAVRGAADIVRIVSDYVPLRPAGARLKGLCPFHQEKTPSFSIDPRANLFYCFGCQTGGDALKFVMLYERVDFPEAVELLARRLGIPIPIRAKGEGAPETEAERVRRINQIAAGWFRATLDAEAGRACRDYLARRGIAEATARRLGLGFAPEGWDGLRRHLQSVGFRPEEMARAGLVVPRRNADGHYDRFRERLIFPIRDVEGVPIAFGGRAIGETQPKYINSPETPAYIKGDHLYGLDLSRDAIRREGFAIVVEGYLDLASLVQAGIEPVVASLGTAFTPAQVKLLGRYTGRVVVCYDGDTAGVKATARSLDLLLERGLEVRVVELPGSTDPDAFVRSAGGQAYASLVQQAPDYLEFLVRHEMRTRDLDRLEEKVAAVNGVLPHIAKLRSAVERAGWVGRLADAVGVEDEVVLQELRGALRAGRERVREHSTPKEPRLHEARLVVLLLRSAEERERFVASESLQLVAGSSVEPIVHAVVRLTREGRGVDFPLLLDALHEEEERALATRIAFRDEPETGPSVEDCLDTFRREALHKAGQQAIRELGRMQAEGERTSSVEETNRWLAHVQHLARERDALH